MSPTPCNSDCASSKNLCTTETRVDEVEFVWTIKNFHLHEAKGTCLKSSLFSSATNDKFKWYLLCLPNGESYKNNTISIYLYLITDVRVRRVDVFVEFTVSTRNQETQFLQTNVCKFSSSRQNCGFPEYLVKNDDFNHELVSNNYDLTFECWLKFSEMKNVQTNFHQCKPKISSRTLSEDLESLFENQEFSDITLTVKGKDYQAHKQILIARSPVFAAMFRHKTTETEQNRVVIEDLNENVMGELLKYIYTGKCQALSKFAEELLVAADKYALDGLKAICMEELSKTLTVENAVNILVFADLHSAKDLKVEAIKFIAAKFPKIVKTKTWKDFLSSNPQLAGEVCEAFASSDKC